MRIIGLLLVAIFLSSAIGCLAPFSWSEKPSVPEPQLVNADEALTKAAQLLDQGQDSAAVPHLRTYVQANPDAVMVRAHLAELLFRQGIRDESRDHFEHFVGLAQPMKGSVENHLVHVHTRLMELASKAEDDFEEELNRGIGLLLLVKKWRTSPERRDEDSEEQTLMKAVKALRAAKELKPTDARVSLYLGEAYLFLGQVGPAQEAFRLAKKHATGSCLTSVESSRLESQIRDLN
jgi:cytochrome c-type biogenesis protein CcmH/NrfG